MVFRVALLATLTVFPHLAQAGQETATNGPGSKEAQTTEQQKEVLRAHQKAEQTRACCIEGRRYIAGRVLQILPDGLIVESGYSRLLSAPLNKSWLVSGTVSVSRDPSAVEENKPDALCIGTVFLGNIPKRPSAKPYDYVVMHGYPAGEFTYSPVPGVQKTVRRFSASLERAVQINLERESK